MRSHLALVAVLSLAGTPVISAAEAAAPAVAAVPVPAANKTLLTQASSLVEQLSAGAHLAQSTAETASALPFAGSAAKDKATAAKALAGDSDGLLAELKNLLAGQKSGGDSMLSKVAAGTLNLGERFKGLPGAEALQGLLGNPGIAQSLISQAPVDKVPGYAAIKGLLGK